MTLVKEGDRIAVAFAMELPCAATIEQVKEWLSFELSELGGMDGSNPLGNFDIEAVYGSVKWNLEK